MLDPKGGDKKKEMYNQRTQKIIHSAATPIVQSMSLLKHMKPGKSVSKEDLKTLKTNMRSSFTCLSIFNSDVESTRKNSILKSLGPSFHTFISEKRDNSEFLFSEPTMKNMNHLLKPMPLLTPHKSGFNNNYNPRYQ